MKYEVPIFSLHNVSVSIEQRVILNHISFDIYSGDFVIIVGGNGAGKSTLFDVMSGKRAIHDDGDILYKGRSIKDQSEVSRACYVTRIFQNTHANCIGSLSLVENIALSKMRAQEVGWSYAVTEEIQKETAIFLDDLGMSPSLMEVPMFALSGGQRQLISFMMSLFLSPEIILLDEPTAALDPQAATKLLVYAKKYIAEKNLTAMLITHDPYIAIHLGNRLFVLESGNIKNKFDEVQKRAITEPSLLLGQIDYDLLV
jgi:putative ABC transport system ATP-binding protein